MTLPPLPKDRNWSPETWRAGLDEAVRRADFITAEPWEYYHPTGYSASVRSIIAHATTLLDAGIVKPVVSEAAELLKAAYLAREASYVYLHECPAAIAVIQSALDKARAGE